MVIPPKSLLRPRLGNFELEDPKFSASLNELDGKTRAINRPNFSPSVPSSRPLQPLLNNEPRPPLRFTTTVQFNP